MAVNISQGGLNMNFSINYNSLPSQIDGILKELQRIREDLSSLNKSSQSTGNSIGSSLKSGFQIGLGMSTIGIIQGAIDKTIQLGKEAFWSAANFEQMRVAFSTMLGSQAEADKLIKQIQDFAIATPYGTTALVDLSKQLLAFGFQAEEVIPTLDRLGNVAAGIGTDKMPNLIYAMGQIRAAGRLVGQDLMQLINAGFNPLQEISRTTGESMTSLKKKMSDGLITFDMVNNAFKTATSEGGKFNQLMQAQSKTTAGKIDALGDSFDKLKITIGQGSTPIVGAFVDSLSDLISSTNDYLSLDTISKIRNEQYEIKALTNAIISNNDNQEVRDSLIRTLNNKYPEFLGHIDQEQITTNLLTQRLVDVNEQYEKRIDLIQKTMRKEALLAGMRSSIDQFTQIDVAISGTPFEKYAGKPEELLKAIKDFQQKGGGRAVNNQGLFATEILGDRRGLNKYFDDNAKILDWAFTDTREGGKARYALGIIYNKLQEAIHSKKQYEDNFEKAIKDEELSSNQRVESIKKSIADRKNRVRNLQSQIKQMEKSPLVNKQNLDYYRKQIVDDNNAIALLEDDLNKINSANSNNNNKNDKKGGLSKQGKKTTIHDIFNNHKRKAELEHKVTTSSDRWTLKTLTDLERDKAEVKEYFDSLRKDIIDFNKDPKNKIKINEKEQLEKLKAKEAEANKVIEDKDKARKLGETLTQQEKQYEAYYNWKEQFGEESARKQFSIEQSYLEVLQAERLKAEEAKNQSALQMLDERIKKEVEREREKDLRILEQAKELAKTQQSELKILNEKYRLMKRSLGGAETNPDGTVEVSNVPKEEMASLNKWYEEQVQSINQKFAKVNIGQILQATTATTRRELMLQINYLSDYVNTAKTLTESQKEAIGRTIDELRGKLLSAQGSNENTLFGIDFTKQEREIEAVERNIQQLKKAIRQTYNDIYQNGGKTTAEQTNQLATLEAQLKAANDTKERLTKSKGMVDLSNHLKLASASAKDLKNVFGGLDETFDAAMDGIISITDSTINAIEAIQKVQESASKAIESATAAIKAAETASAILAIAQVAITLFKSIKNIFNARAKANEDALKLEQERKSFQDKLMYGEQAYNRLLRERRLIMNDLHQSTVRAIRLKEEEIKRALYGEKELRGLSLSYKNGAIDDFKANVLKMMKEGRRIVDKTSEGTLTSDFSGKFHLEGDSMMSRLIEGSELAQQHLRNKLGNQKNISLWGDSLEDFLAVYKEIEQLATEGKLDEATMKIYEQTKLSKEEMDKLIKQAEEMAKIKVEIFAGTTLSGLADDIMNIIQSGKKNFDEFGEDIEKILQKSILSGLKAELMNGALKDIWETYQSFAEKNDGGALTEEQAMELRNKFKGVVEGGIKQLDDMSKVLNLDSLTNESNSLSGAIKGIRQDQADIIGSNLMGMRIPLNQMATDLRKFMDLGTDNLKVQLKIETNTRDTVLEVKNAVAELKMLNNKVKSNADVARSIGGG